MKIMNSRMPLLLLSLAGVCAAWMAIQTGYARSRALTSTSNYVGARAGSSRARWVWQNPIPQWNTLHDVSFVDGSTGTATRHNGTIIRTTDGGNSWVIQSSGTTNTLYGVSFTDVSHGTAVGASGTIVRTTDGGNTWSGDTSGITDGLLAVSSTEANRETALGENVVIARTTEV